MMPTFASKSGYVVPARGRRPRGCLGESGHKVLLVVSDMVSSGDYVDGVTWREVFSKPRRIMVSSYASLQATPVAAFKVVL